MSNLNGGKGSGGHCGENYDASDLFRPSSISIFLCNPMTAPSAGVADAVFKGAAS